jgi:hypothetical protein
MDLYHWAMGDFHWRLVVLTTVQWLHIILQKRSGRELIREKLSCNSNSWSCLENHENDFCKANKKKHNTPTTADNQELLQRKSLVGSKERTFVGIGDGSGAREERATATQKSHETLQLPIPLQQTHVFFFFFFFCFSSTKPR